jgi:hypothetical protein
LGSSMRKFPVPWPPRAPKSTTGPRHHAGGPCVCVRLLISRADLTSNEQTERMASNGANPQATTRPIRSDSVARLRGLSAVQAERLFPSAPRHQLL